MMPGHIQASLYGLSQEPFLRLTRSGGIERMRTRHFVRRLAAVSVMVASASLSAVVAHSASTSEAPVVVKGALADFVDAQSAPIPRIVVDPGLPTKPIPLRVQPTPAETPAPAATAPVAAPPAPAATAPKPATVKTTTKVTNAKTTTTTTTRTASAPAAAAPAAAAPPATSGSVTARQDLASAVAAATNAKRVAAGLKALTYRSCSVPASWAVHMASAGSLTHNSMMTVLTSCGGTSTAGENIAAGYTSVSAVTAGWMGSASHKANIMNPSFTSISVGVAQAANGTYYWVEDFTG